VTINWRASSLHAAVVGVTNAVLQAVTAFGVTLTGAQNVAITSVTNSMLVLLSALLIASTHQAPALPPPPPAPPAA
jgi:hypothetical protein